MPIEIDEVHSEVSVEGRGSRPAETVRLALPQAREMQRWRQLASARAWDEARTRAVDRDD